MIMKDVEFIVISFCSPWQNVFAHQELYTSIL